MNKQKQNESTVRQKTMTDQLAAKAARKMKARSRSNQKIWFGLGMMGLIGWSVAIPTILGAALGIYFDANYPDKRSWTLAFLIAGLVLGCFNAWHWVAKEERAIHAFDDDGERKDKNKVQTAADESDKAKNKSQ